MGTTAQKLEYLGTTKSQLKDMINYGLDDNNKITSSTTFRNYVSSIFNAFLEALRTPNTLFTNLPKKSASGSVISLNDTANAPMRIELGASELSQSGTPTPSSPQTVHTISGSNKVVVCGKNLLDEDTLRNATYNTNTYKNTQTNIIGNQTLYFKASLKEGKTAISGLYLGLSTTPNPNTGDYTMPIVNGVIASTFTPKTFNSNSNLYLAYYPASKSITDIFDTYNLWVSTSDIPYEPYISQEADIDLTGKNIFDGSVGGSAGEYLTSTGSVSSGGSNLRYSNYIKLKTKETSLYVSGMQDTMGTPAICFYNSSKTFISGVAYDSAIEKAITIPTNAVYFRTSYRTNNLYFMIEYGTKKTNYEPYLGIEYCKIGNYEDKIFKNIPAFSEYDSNLIEGAWYIKKNIGKIVLNGSETWTFGADNGTTTYIVNSAITNLKKATSFFSNRFGSTGNDYIQISTTYDERITLGIEDSIVGIESTDTNPQKRQKVQTWLGTNNTDLYYCYINPTYTQITGTLAEQLENVYQKLLSYTGTTNISQINNDLAFNMTIQAIEQ